MTEQDFLSDQTRFTFEQPILESSSRVEPEDPATAEAKKKRRKLMYIVGGVVGSLVLVILILAVVASRRTVAQKKAQPTATPEPMDQQRTDLQARIDTLAEELKAADPAKPPLTFPLVDMNIRLEDER